MAEQFDAMRRDLAFLRSLAEDSQPILRPIGALLAIGGVIHGLSALRFWAVAEGWFGWPDALRPLMGLDGVLLQLGAMAVVARAWPAAMTFPKAAVSPGARAATGAVKALAWALGTSALGFVLATMRGGDGELMWTSFPIVLFALTGATWQVVFATYRRGWALWAAVGSSLCAVAVGLAAGTAANAAFIAAGFFLCLAWPGFLMLRFAEAE